jgi:hypothetical protein
VAVPYWDVDAVLAVDSVRFCPRAVPWLLDEANRMVIRAMARMVDSLLDLSIFVTSLLYAFLAL